MDAKLVVITGKTSKRIVQLQLPAVLGRSREADVTVAHPMISRRHCELFEQDGLLMLRDMASLNGTMIAGRKVVLAPLLTQGEFSIGPISFRVLYEFKGDLASLPETQFAEPDPGLQMPSVHSAPQTDFEGLPSFGHADDASINDSVQMPSSDVLAWADAEDQSPPPTPPPSAAQIAARQTARSKPPTSPPPTNVHPLRNLSVPRDKLPTVPVSEVTLPPNIPPIEAAAAELEADKNSPWDDGELPPATHPKHRPPPGSHDAADDDFGNFLEALQ